MIASQFYDPLHDKFNPFRRVSVIVVVIRLSILLSFGNVAFFCNRSLIASLCQLQMWFRFRRERLAPNFRTLPNRLTKRSDNARLSAQLVG